MTKPVVMATTLVTEDGVPIDAIHLPGRGDLAIVVAHGFTLSWQRPSVWRVAASGSVPPRTSARLTKAVPRRTVSPASRAPSRK